MHRRTFNDLKNINLWQITHEVFVDAENLQIFSSFWTTHIKKMRSADFYPTVNPPPLGMTVTWLLFWAFKRGHIEQDYLNSFLAQIPDRYTDLDYTTSNIPTLRNQLQQEGDWGKMILNLITRRNAFFEGLKKYKNIQNPQWRDNRELEILSTYAVTAGYINANYDFGTVQFDRGFKEKAQNAFNAIPAHSWRKKDKKDEIRRDWINKWQTTNLEPIPEHPTFNPTSLIGIEQEMYESLANLRQYLPSMNTVTSYFNWMNPYAYAQAQAQNEPDLEAANPSMAQQPHSSPSTRN